MGSYTMDSHNRTRFVNLGGKVMNEGDVRVPPAGPYDISTGRLLQRPGEAENLIVPVGIGTSHIAYGSAPMEPVFTALSHAAAVMSGVAIRRGCPVTEVHYAEVRGGPDAAGQVTSP